MKTLILLLLLLQALFAQSYNFTELRYSDALGQTAEFEGKIIFFSDALIINYEKYERVLEYRDGKLLYLQNNEPQELAKEQTQGIIEYFEILLLLHKGDESSLESEFTLNKTKDKTLLIPRGALERFLLKIELKKEAQTLKEVKLFLKNNDTITIRVENEIR